MNHERALIRQTWHLRPYIRTFERLVHGERMLWCRRHFAHRKRVGRANFWDHSRADQSNSNCGPHFSDVILTIKESLGHGFEMSYRMLRPPTFIWTWSGSILEQRVLPHPRAPSYHRDLWEAPSPHWAVQERA